MLRPFAIFAALCAALPGCEKPPASRPAQSGSSSSSAPDAATQPAGDVDALRNLPYAGSVNSDEDPDLSGLVSRDAARSAPGLTLYVAHTSSLAELVDEQGKVVRSWKHAPSRHWDNADLLPTGDLLVVGADLSERRVAGIVDEKRYLLRFDWSGKLIWKKYLLVHHDVERAPDGSLLTLTFTRRDEPTISTSAALRDDNITRLSMAGDVIESFSMFDMIRAGGDRFPLQTVRAASVGGRSWVDLFHSNSVEAMADAKLAGESPLFSLDNVLVCFRHQDRVAIFNLKSREVVWSWGKGLVSGPHDAQLLPSGNILLLDNGLGRGESRALEVDPRADKVVWEYKAANPKSFYTPSKGSVQRLANGNTLICNADSGRIIEVTPAGETVWNFLCTQQDPRGRRGTFVRAKRYTHEFIDAIRKSTGE